MKRLGYQTVYIAGLACLVAFSACREANDQGAHATMRTKDLEVTVGHEITEFEQRFDYTIVYLRLESSDITFPWRIMASDVHLVKTDGRRVPVAGSAIVQGPVVTMSGVAVLESEPEGGMQLEPMFGGGLVQLLVGLDRPPEPDEVVYAFVTESDALSHVEIALSSGGSVTIPVSEKSVRRPGI